MIILPLMICLDHYQLELLISLVFVANSMDLQNPNNWKLLLLQLSDYFNSFFSHQHLDSMYKMNWRLLSIMSNHVQSQVLNNFH